MFKKGVIKMFKKGLNNGKYSFMNYYCVRRLLDEGACESDFVQCFVDVNDTIYLYPLNCLTVGRCGVMFLGYGRRH